MTTPGRRPAGSSATRRESDQQRQLAEQMLPLILRRISEFTALSDQGYFEVQENSTLWLDDAAVRPLNMSAVARAGILSSIDHLRAIAIIVEAGTTPWVALFSLIRSAIETSAVTIYNLQPTPRKDRVLRLARGHCAEIADRERFRWNMGQDAPDREASESLVRRGLGGFPSAGAWRDVTGPKGGGTDASISTKVGVASAEVERTLQKGQRPTAVLGTWQVFSGLTHARQYAHLAILDREELGYDVETGIVNAHLTTGTYTLAGSILIAIDVVDTAVRLYGVRARAHTNLPEDVDFVGVRLRAGEEQS